MSVNISLYIIYCEVSPWKGQNIKQFTFYNSCVTFTCINVCGVKILTGWTLMQYTQYCSVNEVHRKTLSSMCPSSDLH